ncbi:O-antigen ligase [Marinobacterium sp. LSUCC0821]|uniref:O-antigen ligase family protein n=1 Tax=Marinobacterium sp. LSUCC0821 TaxID=2668067 RepID=UPI00145133C6|nr:O-antigen ligase family protein [Marinobacterium sp. LSUCC0821]QJD72190.1 O-antigen ligase family protein [Marinobacterium sp. LSUCC0821]
MSFDGASGKIISSVICHLGYFVLNAIHRHHFTILLSGFFFLLAFGKSSTLPLLLMAMIGAFLLLKEIRTGKVSSDTKWLILSGSCILIPAGFSLVTSIDIPRSLEFIATYPLYFLAAYFIYFRLKEGIDIWPSIKTISSLILIWGALAIWQYLDPSNPFGPGGSHNQGIFTRNNPFTDGSLMLGFILGTLFPFITFSLWQTKYYKTSILIGMLIVILCYISGTRASWVSIAFTLFMVPIIFFSNGHKLKPIYLLGILIGLLFFSLTLSSLYRLPGLSQRIDATLLVFKEPTIENLDHSLSGRLDLWIDGFNIGVSSPIAGTGVNNFRYAQPMLEKPAGIRWIHKINDPKIPHELEGAAHTHQLFFDAWSGAGAIGVLGLMLFYIRLFHRTRESIKTGDLVAIGAMVALWAGFLPFNTQNNLYGSWTTAWFWVWCGIAIGLTSRSVNNTTEELHST